MAVPDFQSLMLPVLKRFADGTEQMPADIRGAMAEEFKLTAADLAVLLPSGKQATFSNRVAWSLGYLKQAGLLESPTRAHYRLTERGRELLKTQPDRIDISFLERYPDFQAFRHRVVEAVEPVTGAAPAFGVANIAAGPVLTPDEQIRVGAASLRQSLAVQLLERMKQASPAFFESVVVDLLVAMGYGGSHADAARVVGRSGDGGIDGVIKEDRLGLESIYVQAKRWEATVGRPTIQQFAGALAGHHARKGVVITTSAYSQEAIGYAETLPTTIVLIDGQQLAELMIEFGVGVSDVDTIRLRRVDEEYFGEE
jgi:restriction system protein